MNLENANPEIIQRLRGWSLRHAGQMFVIGQVHIFQRSADAPRMVKIILESGGDLVFPINNVPIIEGSEMDPIHLRDVLQQMIQAMASMQQAIELFPQMNPPEVQYHLTESKRRLDHASRLASRLIE